MNSLIDYLGYIVIKFGGPVLRFLPFEFSLFLGRRLGDLFYALDPKHRYQAYVNIKRALGGEICPKQIRYATRRFFRSFGQNLIEIFFIPLLDRGYMDKHITLEGKEHVTKAFTKGKGVILLGFHAGSWELSNVIWADMGFPFNLLVRDQKFPRITKLLNSLRKQKGCKLVERHNQMRSVVEALKNNEAVGMTADQGGRNGVLVKFFGRNASMATGAVKLALKYGSVIIPGYYARSKGPNIRVIIEPPFEVKKTQDKENDVKDNVQALTQIFEKNIRKYPWEYLWNYKVWKYSDEKSILIVSDGKAGHLRQAQAAAEILKEQLQARGIKVSVSTVIVKFRGKFSKVTLALCALFSRKYSCQGCMGCLKHDLDQQSYKALLNHVPDIIISCGSQSALVNYILSRQNMSRSITILKPSFLNTSRFDLVIVPKHDKVALKKNVVTVEGALNLIGEKYLREQVNRLSIRGFKKSATGKANIGLLIGGDAKNFRLDSEAVLEVLRQIKSAADNLDADILVSTSRRTSPEIEDLVKNELAGNNRCKLLVIANEKNIPEAVGGILGLCDIVVVSPESISMISEAASSGKYVVVFEGKVSRKHSEFLRGISEKKYIYLVPEQDVAAIIDNLLVKKPKPRVLNDREIIKKGLLKII